MNNHKEIPVAVRPKVPRNQVVKKQNQAFFQAGGIHDNPRRDQEEVIQVPCRTIAVGSYKQQALDVPFEVTITHREIKFELQCVTGAEVVDVCIQRGDVIQMLVHFGVCLPVLLIQTTPTCARKIRTKLAMNNKDKAYFDPCSSDERLRQVILLPVTLGKQKPVLKRMYLGRLLEIGLKTANELVHECLNADKAKDNSEARGRKVYCSQIQVGSHIIKEKDTNLVLCVTLNSNGIFFKFPSVQGTENAVVCLQKNDITSLLLHVEIELPVLFVQTSSSNAEKIRATLGMTDKNKAFYDPCCLDETINRIVIFPFSITNYVKLLRDKYSSCLQEISIKIAKKILAKTVRRDGNKGRNRSLTRSNLHAKEENQKRPSRRSAPHPSPFTSPGTSLAMAAANSDPPEAAAQCLLSTNDSWVNYECSCCCNDVPFEYMVQCLDGHLFCIQCMQRYVHEAVFGGGKSKLTCLNESCEQLFPESQLQRALPDALRTRLLERVQEEELNLANLKNFYRCPFCSFGAVVENEMYLICANQHCLQVTCIHCQVTYSKHKGLNCKEIEDTNETNIRKQFEEKMAAAKIRQCSKCLAKFTKEEGCNKIQCRCGTLMCYLCRQVIKGYSHFCEHVRSPGKGCNFCKACKLFTNNEQDDEMVITELKIDASRARKMLGYREEKEIGVPIQQKEIGVPVKKSS